VRVCGACGRRHGQQKAGRVISRRVHRKGSVLRLLMACKAGRIAESERPGKVYLR